MAAKKTDDAVVVDDTPPPVGDDVEVVGPQVWDASKTRQENHEQLKRT